ncbi:MAG: response regulator [Pseudomonadota bacterium]
MQRSENRSDDRPRGRSKILVVDDDEAVRIVTAQMLRRLPLSVQCVSSGQEALVMLNGGEYDVILLDVGMPVMSGIELYALIRRMLPEQKVVFMTGYSEEEITDLDNRNTWILSKPFSMQSLTSLVGNLLA